jgi:hypothetical protein
MMTLYVIYLKQTNQLFNQKKLMFGLPLCLLADFLIVALTMTWLHKS